MWQLRLRNRAACHDRIKELRSSQSAGVQMQAGMKVAWETMQKALEKVSTDLGNERIDVA